MSKDTLVHPCTCVHGWTRYLCIWLGL